MSQNNPLSKVIGVILVIVIIVFAVFWVQTSGKLSDNQNATNTLKTQLQTLQSQLATDQSQITTLSNQLTTTQSQLGSASSTAASLKTQLTADEATISSLSSQISAANSKVADLTTQLSNTGSGITSLQNQEAKDATAITNLQTQLTTATSQLTSATSQISTLQTQVSTLQSQVASGTGTGTGTGQTAVLSGQTFTLSGGQQTLLTSFTASSSGTLVVSGSTTTTTGYLRVNNSAYGSSTNFLFTGSSISIPVQAGYNSLYMGDNDAAGSAATATMNAYVSYGSSGTGSGQTTLLTAQVYTLFGGQQTLITQFPASSAGILLVSGSVTSSTAYLRLNNSSFGSSSNYPFVNGSNVSIQFQPGTNSIYMGNNDPAGTNPTATLNAYISYSASGGGTGQTTILSAQSFSLTPGGQTLLTSFNAGSTGSLTVTGSTTSPTAYIRVYNSVYGSSANYNFTSGSTISIPVQAGYNTIYFGNSDATTLSATISATYMY